MLEVCDLFASVWFVVTFSTTKCFSNCVIVNDFCSSTELHASMQNIYICLYVKMFYLMLTQNLSPDFHCLNLKPVILPAKIITSFIFKEWVLCLLLVSSCVPLCLLQVQLTHRNCTIFQVNWWLHSKCIAQQLTRASCCGATAAKRTPSFKIRFSLHGLSFCKHHLNQKVILEWSPFHFI